MGSCTPEGRARLTEIKRAAVATRWARPGAGNLHGEAMRRAHAIKRAKAQAAVRRVMIVPPPPPTPAKIDVPGWVERADLVDDYRDVAAEHDEFAAAAHCRRLLAEARA